jgi:hypothetical protein
MGWVTIKAAFRRNYMLGMITAITLMNEILVLGIGGK